MPDLQKSFEFLDDIKPTHTSLADRFIVPPFTILDARQGYWQDRKRAWLALGIQSELGRGNMNLGMSHPETTSTIDFYHRKREIESLLGHEISKNEAADMISDEGQLKNARQSNRQHKTYTDNPKQKARVFNTKAAPGAGGAWGSYEVVMGIYKTNSRHEADRRSNLNKAPKKPEGATGTGTENMAPGTSVFDPVLCELMYHWFCPPNASILDPFAGGSVRGIVASYLGHHYTGIELRQEQVDANIKQATEMNLSPHWIVGNSYDLCNLTDDKYDFVFSCPPYYNLEVYSDLDGELSAIGTYEEFLEQYALIIYQSILLLKNNRFACFVVGDIRDKRGFYYNFVSDTIQAFIDSGCHLYNEAILITSVGSLPIRVSKQFNSGRKLGKTHQNILVFYKGDNPKKIKLDFPQIE